MHHLLTDFLLSFLIIEISNVSCGNWNDQLFDVFGLFFFYKVHGANIAPTQSLLDGMESEHICPVYLLAVSLKPMIFLSCRCDRRS